MLEVRLGEEVLHEGLRVAETLKGDSRWNRELGKKGGHYGWTKGSKQVFWGIGGRMLALVTRRER